MIFVGLNTLILLCSPVGQGAFFELYYCVRQQCVGVLSHLNRKQPNTEFMQWLRHTVQLI